MELGLNIEFSFFNNERAQKTSELGKTLMFLKREFQFCGDLCHLRIAATSNCYIATTFYFLFLNGYPALVVSFSQVL